MKNENFKFLNEFENKFINNLKNNFKFLLNSSEKIKILVGVSGGSDSICLLYLLYELNKKVFNNIMFNFDIIALHINHMIRQNDSDEDEKFVKNFCEKLKIKIITQKIYNLKNCNFGIEEKARKERYNIFYNFAKEENIKYLFLAHNYDDDAETIFMKILRGTGINGLTGIKNIREYHQDYSYSSFFILRPFLIFKKKEIEKYLFLKQIEFRVDKSNFENDFFRNKIRNMVFPNLEKLGNIKKNLIKIKYILEEEKLFFDEHFFKINKNIIDIFGINEKPMILDNRKFLEINKNFLSLAFNYLLKNNVDFVHIKKIKNLFLEQNFNFQVFIKNNLIFVAKGNRSFLVSKDVNFNLEEEKDLDIDNIIFELNNLLFLKKNNKFLDKSYFFYEILYANYNDFIKKFNIKKPLSGYFDYDLIKKYIGDENNLIFRKSNFNDVFMPFGKEKIYTIKEYFSKQTKKSKKIENFEKDIKDQKIKNLEDMEDLVSKILSKIFLAKKNSNEIFWIIGDRISNKLKITSSTKKILRIEIKLDF